jgi:hypothetical protein
MKKLLFLAGLASGFVLAQNWKGLTKEGIKIGIQAGRKIREVSQQALDDIEDVTAEAMVELSQQEQEAKE